MFAFSAVNLGCSKNLVDLEFAIGEILKWSDRAPVEYISDPEDPNAEYVYERGDDPISDYLMDNGCKMGEEIIILIWW